MFNFMFQNSGAKILAKIVFVLFVFTSIPNGDCREEFYSLPCPKSIAEKIKSWTNTFLSDVAEQAFLFLSQDTETSPWCFNLLFKGVSPRKPMSFCLVENISLLFLFLNKIIWKQGEQRPWLQRSWGLTLRRWWQNFLQDLLQSLSEITAEDSAESSVTYGASLFIKAANQMCYQVLQGLHLCPEYQDYPPGEVFLAKNLVTILRTVRAFEVSKQGSGKKNSTWKYRSAPSG